MTAFIQSSQKTKNVLIVISNIAINGGAEKVATTVANEFSKRNIPTTLLTFYTSNNEHTFSCERISMHEPTPSSLLGKIPRAIHRMKCVKKVCDEKKVDLVISFLEESNYYSLLSKVFFFNRTRMVVSVRNDPTQYNFIYKLLIRVLYPLAEKVVAVNKGVEKKLKDDFGLTNTMTIYNPVDVDSIEEKLDQEVAKEYQWITKEKLVFLTIGRLTVQKGQWHLIRAFTEVVKRSPDAILIIIGEGPYQNTLEEHIRFHQLEKNVFLIGRQTNVFPFMKLADVFVLPSLWEGMPNALLEALTVGLPVVATDASTGAREILAPELSLETEVTYPFKVKRGVLTQPFSVTEESIHRIRESLTTVEQEFSNQLNHIATLELKESSLLLDKRFHLSSIVDAWRALI